MNPTFMIVFGCVFFAAVVFGLSACSDSNQPKPITGTVHPDLKKHSSEFRQEVIRITDGVYVAVGFGLANSILLEGDAETIIVDTMESEEAAKKVKAAFDRITEKPLKAIIYTHYHPDHDFGTTVFAENGVPDIISHESTLTYLDRITSVTRETTHRRAVRQFGTMLPEGGLINCGIGPYLDFGQENTIGLIRPNKTFSGEQYNYEIAGLKLTLYHAPGETNDQIFVWIPEKKVLLPADNFYRSFPNLYAIRGTAYRDVTQWVRSLDRMRALRADYLVPSHTRPIYGADEIFETLTNYRDAIQFVHDQTIRGINLGKTPDEIVSMVKLPSHLANQPYLHEYYGTVEWSVRAIFNGYLGWFSGNATDLFPLSKEEKAQRISKLAGGEKELLKVAGHAVENGDYQWALELCDHLMTLNPDLDEARKMKAYVLNSLGEKQIAATARNYYLTQAMEVDGRLDIPQRKTKEIDLVHSIPLAAIFNGLAVKLDPVKSADVDKMVGFKFPDTGAAYTVHVRRGVAEIQPRFSENSEIVVTVDENIWKEIAARMRNPAISLVNGDIKVEGGTFDLVVFLGLFSS